MTDTQLMRHRDANEIQALAIEKAKASRAQGARMWEIHDAEVTRLKIMYAQRWALASLCVP